MNVELSKNGNMYTDKEVVMSTKETMPTIWRVPDELWAKFEAILAETDAPKATGRKRVDARLVIDTLIYRLRSGCQWNHLPSELADDSSAHRTLQRWGESRGVHRALGRVGQRV